MSNKIIFRTEDLKEAIASFSENASEETFIGIIIAMANAYQQDVVLPVAAEGEVFRTIHDDNDGDFISVFTDLDEAEMGPDTDLILMTPEDIISNIMDEEDLSGFIINPFSEPIFVDRDAIKVITDTAMSGPYKNVTINVEGLDPEEMVDLAYDIEKGENNFVPDPSVAASIYSNVIDDDFELRPDDPDPEEDYSYRRAKAAAMNNLGVLHITGYGVGYDREEAIELFNEAAKDLNTQAMCNLAAVHEDDGEYSEAAELYERASLLGDDKGLVGYSGLLLKGLGTDKDPDKALALLMKAMENGEESAYYYLGLIWEEGLTGFRDHEKAGWFYEMGSISGDVRSMDGYVRIFGEPFGSDEDDDEDSDGNELIFDTDDDRRFVIDMSKLPGGVKN